MRSMTTRSLALTVVFCVISLIGCAATLTTIPQNHVLGTSDESAVFGRLVFDLEKPPLPFFASLMRMGLVVRNEATQQDYVWFCDRTGLDSEFFASLPPGQYRLVTSVDNVKDAKRTPLLPFRIPYPRFEVRAGEVQYLGTIRFRGAGGDSSLRGGGAWLIEDDSVKTTPSFREKFPRITQPIVKSAMLEGSRPVLTIALAASGRENIPNRIVSEKLIGQIHPSPIPESIIVSPDGKRFAYVAVSRGLPSGEKQFLVVDGREEKQYDYVGAGTLIFSPDSQRLAYGAIVSKKVFLVLDGREEKTYDTIGGRGPVFSPDSRRVAYSAAVGNKHFVVVDGREDKTHDAISTSVGGIAFSPDSQRLAYVARLGNKWFVVVDGKDEKQYDSIGQGTPNFSPDSKRIAYAAQSGNKWVVVVDGKEEKHYDTSDRLVFSPDSQRVAYGARVGNKWLVVVDGKEGKQYDRIGAGTLIFSPDSKRVAYAAQSGNKWVVVVDGNDGTQYDAFLRGGRIVFDRPDSFHNLAAKGSEIYLVEEMIKP